MNFFLSIFTHPAFWPIIIGWFSLMVFLRFILLPLVIPKGRKKKLRRASR